MVSDGNKLSSLSIISPLLALLFVCAGINSSTVYIPCIVTKGLGIAILSDCLLPKRSFKC